MSANPPSAPRARDLARSIRALARLLVTLFGPRRALAAAMAAASGARRG